MHELADHSEMPAQRGASWLWIGAVMLVIIAWAGAFALRGGEKEVMPGWADGIQAGQATAKEADKPMVVLFTAAWCGACQELKRDVLSHPNIQKRLTEDFVPVQVDLTDRSSANPNMAVAQRYGIEFLPTVIVMSPDGEPINASTGLTTVENFAGRLDQITFGDLPVEAE